MNAVEFPTIADEDMPRWEQWIEGVTGITLEGRKRALESCIYQRLLGRGLPSLEAYQRVVRDGAEGDAEKAALIDQLTVKDSRFFRDVEAMDSVVEYMRGKVAALDGKGESFRIWSVGCALGQEAWSLGMLAAECFAYTDVDWQVLGTDISLSALAQAREARYPERQLHRVSEHRRRRFFSPVENGLQVQEHLKSRVVFGASNLKDIAVCPYEEQDVIFCQNVLIYFRDEMARHIVSELARRLRPGGLLVLGAGEIQDWDTSALERWRPEIVNAYRAR